MAQSLARLWTHLIFSTKNRFPFLSDKQIRADMHGYLAKVLREHDCETLIVGGVEDHVHTLFALSRNYSIADVVKEIKRTSNGTCGTETSERNPFGVRAIREWGLYPGWYPGVKFANTFGVVGGDYAPPNIFAYRSGLRSLRYLDPHHGRGYPHRGVQAATRPRAGLSPPDRLM